MSVQHVNPDPPKTVAWKDTSGEVEWGTPQPIFDALNARFGFTLDVCASAVNHKCARYFTKDDDGLLQDWSSEVCWMNPPYGRGEIDRWMRKAWEASIKGATVVCLVPSSTDTAWWHDYAAKGSYEFLRGRIKFIRPDGTPAPGSPAFGSVVVIFRPEGAASQTIPVRMRLCREMEGELLMLRRELEAEAHACLGRGQQGGFDHLIDVMKRCPIAGEVYRKHRDGSTNAAEPQEVTRG